MIDFDAPTTYMKYELQKRVSSEDRLRQHLCDVLEHFAYVPPKLVVQRPDLELLRKPE